MKYFLDDISTKIDAFETASSTKNKMSKTTVSIALKRRTWYERFGRDVGQTKCPVCKDKLITQLDFHNGHIEPETESNTVFENLIPICGTCNVACGNCDLRVFTRSIYGRNLLIPSPEGEIIATEPEPSPILEKFCEEQFIFKSELLHIPRNEFVKFIRGCIAGTQFKFEDICYYLNKKHNIDVSIPSLYINGLMIRCEYEERCRRDTAAGMGNRISSLHHSEVTVYEGGFGIRRDRRCEMDKIKNEIFTKFFMENFIEDPMAEPLNAREVKLIWRNWISKRSTLSRLREIEVLDRMKEKYCTGSTDTIFYGIRVIDDEEIAKAN